MKERRKNRRLRRLINCAYGMSLVVCAPSWAAGPSAPKLMIKPEHGYHGDAAHGGDTSAAQAFRLVFLQLEPRDLFAETGASLPVWDRRHPLNQPLLRALDSVDPEALEFAEHPLRAARDGLGFDFALPDAGNLHLNLYTNRHARSRGLRIDMHPVDSAKEGRKIWSLGATLESSRNVNGEDLIELVPQLMLDLDGFLGLPCQALLEYGNWQPLRQSLTTRARVAQLSLRLEF